MDMIYVKAAPGMKLKHPASPASQVFLSEAPGAYWPDDAFTHRRLRDGGIVLADPPKDEPLQSAAPRAAPSPTSAKTSA